MITVEEAEKLVLLHAKNLPSHQENDVISIENLSSEIILEDLIADRDLPPFDRVAMDGIAIHFEEYKGGNRRFEIESCQKAGEPRKTLKNPSHCIEVMTGATLPKGCDTVIRYEDLQMDPKAEPQRATLLDSVEISFQKNVHFKGSDSRAGDQLIASGSQMNSPQWAIAASIGKTHIKTLKRPFITIVTTGDELVEVGATPEAHQIRKSNSYAIHSSLLSRGFQDISSEHLADNRDLIHLSLEKFLSRSDVLIISGGVSKGKFDFVPSVLQDLKVKRIFHGVLQKPGKPLWFGVTEEGKAVFGLPGNPVSALVCLHRYVLPFLEHHEKSKTRRLYAVLKSEVKTKKKMTTFIPITLHSEIDGTLAATPALTNGSGDFSSLARSSGFMELPSGQDTLAPGGAYPLYLWGSL